MFNVIDRYDCWLRVLTYFIWKRRLASPNIWLVSSTCYWQCIMHQTFTATLLLVISYQLSPIFRLETTRNLRQWTISRVFKIIRTKWSAQQANNADKKRTISKTKSIQSTRNKLLAWKVPKLFYVSAEEYNHDFVVTKNDYLANL